MELWPPAARFLQGTATGLRCIHQGNCRLSPGFYMWNLLAHLIETPRDSATARGPPVPALGRSRFGGLVCSWWWISTRGPSLACVTRGALYGTLGRMVHGASLQGWPSTTAARGQKRKTKLQGTNDHGAAGRCEKTVMITLVLTDEHPSAGA